MDTIKGITNFVKGLIKKYYIHFWFLVYLSYIIIYFNTYNNGDLGYVLIFNFLFTAVTALTEIATISSILNHWDNKRDFDRLIKKFEKNHKECKKEDILFLENEKIKLYTILFKERKSNWKRIIGIFVFCIVHMAIVIGICLKLFLIHNIVDWSVFTNIYPYTIFLVYFVQIAIENRINEKYTEMQHRGKRKKC